MRQTLEVEDLLAELRQEGQLQSSGRFTLDVKQAREKLAQFQLADPFCYVLKLIQCAVAGDATAFRIRSGSTEVEVTMEGLDYTLAQLENLLYYLLQETPMEVVPGLRHLAVAVNAAVGTRASQLVLRSWDGEKGVQVAWTTAGASSKAWKPKGRAGPRMQFWLRRVLTDVLSDVYAKVASRSVLDMIGGGRQGMDHEQGLLYDKCQFCPIPVSINGKLAPGYELGEPPPGVFDLGYWWDRLWGRAPAMPGGYHLYEVYLTAPRGCLAPPRLRHSAFTPGFQGESLLSAVLAVPASLRGISRVIAVADGVVLPGLELSWNGPPTNFYMDVSSFETDLTGMALVRSDRLIRHCRDLAREVVARGKDYLASNLSPPRGDQRERLDSFLQKADPNTIRYGG